MEQESIKQVASLKMIVVILASVSAFFLFSTFDDRRNDEFEVIDAGRINTIGDNGKLAIVLSNRKHVPGVVANGKADSKQFSDGRDSRPGIIFYNE